MGSSSDDESHEVQVDEIEEMSVGSDAELLEDTEKGPKWNHKESKKKKRSYDPRYAVPTYEEKQMMRNADMDIEMSLLEVEAAEFVKTLSLPHKCEGKIKSFIKKVEDFLQQLPEKDITLDDVDKESTFIHTIPGHTAPLRIHFCKPDSISVLETYDQLNQSSTPMYIDMYLVLNTRSFAPTDFQNWTYLNKRSLYLAALFPLLSRAFPSLSLHFAWLHGDFDKPLLQLALPASVCAHRCFLRLLPALPATFFPAAKLAPSKTNVRVPGVSPAGPTWFYNSTVLEDLLFPHYVAWLRRAALRAPALRTAGNLVQHWITAGGLDPHFDGFIGALLLAAMVETGEMGAQLSPWQMFGAFLAFLARSAMDETPFVFRSAGEAAIPAVAGLDCMQLIDGSFGFVATYRIPAESAREIIAHAKTSLALFHSRGDSRTLPRLVGRPPFLGGKYDVALRLALADLRRNALYRDDPAGLNFPRFVVAQRDVERWAKRGLGARASLLRSQFLAGTRWRVGEAVPVPAGLLLLFNCNPANISRLADRGPAAKSPEVETWKQLWGDRSELRRFKDGSIVYTNLWSCRPGENHLIPVEIVRYVLSLHTFAVIELKCLSAPLQEWIPRGTVEAEIPAELLRDIMETANSHNKTAGIDYGAHIASIDPASSSLLGAALFPAEPHPLLQTGVAAAPRVTRLLPAGKWVMRMQGATNLPDDPAALQRVKTLWFSSLAALWDPTLSLTCRLAKKGLDCVATQTSLDLVYRGRLHRFLACTDREATLLPRVYRTRPQIRGEIVELLVAPPHCAAVKNAALQNPAFLPAVRTLRLWADSHLLSAACPAMITEMIMMAVLTPSTAALNPAVAFVRALELIVGFAWHSDVLFVDPTGSFTESEKRGILQEIEIVRAQPSEKRALFIVAPYDRTSICTVETPDKPSWAHVQIVAQRTLQKLQADWLTLGDETPCFTPRYSDFDFVITLNDVYLTPFPRGMKLVCDNHESRGAAYECEGSKNLMLDRSRFLVGYEPERELLRAVQEEVGNGGVAMMNTAFGRKIGVSWKPSYFLPMKLSMGNVRDCCPVKMGEDVLLVRDVFDLMRRIRAKLGNAVKSIDF